MKYTDHYEKHQQPNCDDFEIFHFPFVILSSHVYIDVGLAPRVILIVIALSGFN
jgi:hypothetical protein